MLLIVFFYCDGKFIRNDRRLHAVYVSNFSCGPDSFVISFFKRLMAPKRC